MCQQRAKNQQMNYSGSSCSTSSHARSNIVYYYILFGIQPTLNEVQAQMSARSSFFGIKGFTLSFSKASLTGWVEGSEHCIFPWNKSCMVILLSCTLTLKLVYVAVHVVLLSGLSNAIWADASFSRQVPRAAKPWCSDGVSVDPKTEMPHDLAFKD